MEIGIVKTSSRASIRTQELRDNFKQATPEHIGGCLFALIDAKRRQVGSKAIARPVAQMMEDGSIEWGDGSISHVNEDRSAINHSDGTSASLRVDGTIIDSDGQVLKLRPDGIITADGTVLGADGEITTAPSGPLHMFRALTTEQQTAAILELIEFSQTGNAGEILVDLTATELRETIRPMGASDQAKVFIEIGRMSPSQAARAASVLSHTEAASVVSIMVNPGSSGRCDEPFMGPFLEALAPQILRNIEPPTAVGGALATHLSPTAAAHVLHKLEPMDVCVSSKE